MKTHMISFAATACLLLTGLAAAMAPAVEAAPEPFFCSLALARSDGRIEIVSRVLASTPREFLSLRADGYSCVPLATAVNTPRFTCVAPNGTAVGIFLARDNATILTIADVMAAHSLAATCTPVLPISS